MPTVYVDLLLILNGCIDGLLLSAVAVLRHLPHTRLRLLSGAVVGALSSLIILLPSLPAPVLALSDILVAAAMVRCAFPFTSKRSYFLSVGVLFLLSALFSGLSFLLWYFVAPNGFYIYNNTVYYDVSPLLLLGTTLCCYLLSRLAERLREKAVPPAKHLTLTAENRGQTVQFTALHDTGFSLCDGFSGNPVVLIDKTTAAPLLPAEYPAVTTGFRLIPCHTVAGDGLLYAFRPERLTVSTDKGEQPLSGTLLALSDQLKNEPFNALCGDDVAKFCVK